MTGKMICIAILYIFMWLGMYGIYRETAKGNGRLGPFLWCFFWWFILPGCGVALVAQTVVSLYRSREDWMV